MYKLVAKTREQTWDQFKWKVSRHLTGEETEPWEIFCFKAYESQLPVIEQAIEIAALMLASDKSRGYCLEMICADFLAGANSGNGDPGILLSSLVRLFELLPSSFQSQFLEQVKQPS